MGDYYVHNIDQYMFYFPDFIADILPVKGVSWYGTMYLLGFICAFYLFEYLRKKEFIPLKSKDETNDLINYVFFGVIIGGRLGHVLFYQPEIYFADPISIFKVWEGGMASHGGIIGVMIGIHLFAKKHQYNTWNLLDAGSLVAIPGLGFGRFGNFINGEMPGKVTDVAWAVIFPTTDMNARHPVQIYQTLGSGVFLFIVMWFILPRDKFKPGFHLSMFMVFYGIQRIVTEFFRMETTTLSSSFGGVTQGQVLSILMIFVGFWLFRYTQKIELTN